MCACVCVCVRVRAHACVWKGADGMRGEGSLGPIALKKRTSITNYSSLTRSSVTALVRYQLHDHEIFSVVLMNASKL